MISKEIKKKKKLNENKNHDNLRSALAEIISIYLSTLKTINNLLWCWEMDMLTQAFAFNLPSKTKIMSTIQEITAIMELLPSLFLKS